MVYLNIQQAIYFLNNLIHYGYKFEMWDKGRKFVRLKFSQYHFTQRKISIYIIVVFLYLGTSIFSMWIYGKHKAGSESSVHNKTDISDNKDDAHSVMHSTETKRWVVKQLAEAESTRSRVNQLKENVPTKCSKTCQLIALLWASTEISCYQLILQDCRQSLVL